MKKIVPGISLLCMLLLLQAGPLNAQASNEMFTLLGGLSIPTGDFADNDGGVDDGYANVGFLLGGEYLAPFDQNPELGWVSSLAILYNKADDQLAAGTDADIGAWVNIPILTGLRYQSRAESGIQIYGQGQIGLNLASAPKIEIGSEDVTADLAASFGFSIGAGIILNEGMNLSLRYLGLGEPEIEYEFSDGSTTSDDQPIGIIQISAGIPL